MAQVDVSLTERSRIQRVHPFFLSLVLANIRWGLQAGLLYVALLVTIVLAAYLVTAGENIAATGLSIVEVLIFYVLAGALGGIVLGLCRPLLRKRAGAIFVGFLVMLPVSSLMVLLLRPEWSIRRKIFGMLVEAALLGPLYAACMFYGAKIVDRRSH